MPMLLTMWGMLVERCNEPAWYHFVEGVSRFPHIEDRTEALRILTKATRALEDGGIKPDDLITTETTRKALEWLFQEAVIKSNKAAVVNSIRKLLAKFN